MKVGCRLRGPGTLANTHVFPPGRKLWPGGVVSQGFFRIETERHKPPPLELSVPGWESPGKAQLGLGLTDPPWA